MPAKPQQRRDYRILCKLMREWRLRAGLSQRKLSKRLRRPITYASKVEARDRRVDPIELADWAHACGVKPRAIIKAMGL